MDSEVIKIILYVLAGGAVLLVLVRLANKTRKCAVCGSDAKDSYKDQLDKDTILCRNHLVERWKKDVNASTENMVVIEPDFVACPYAYLYADIERLKKWSYTKEDQNNINSILDGISGKTCRDCNKTASVAYFKKEDYQFPFMGKISASPSYLCKMCMTNKIAPLISTAGGHFIEGIYAPLKVRGVYHVQEF
jgi:hypothetical protein